MKGEVEITMGRHLSWPEDWSNFARAAGGRRELAERLLTTPKQLDRWALGEQQPREFAEGRIMSLALRLHVKSPIASTEDPAKVIERLQGEIRRLEARIGELTNENRVLRQRIFVQQDRHPKPNF